MVMAPDDDHFEDQEWGPVRFRQDIYVHCLWRRLGGDPEDADDATQETLRRAFRSWKKYDPARASLLTWLKSIANNVCNEILKARYERGHHIVPLFEGSVSEVSTASNEYKRVEDRVAIEEALNRIDEKHSKILRLRFEEDYTLDRIAKELGVSVKTVQNYIYTARECLRKELDRG